MNSPESQRPTSVHSLCPQETRRHCGDVGFRETIVLASVSSTNTWTIESYKAGDLIPPTLITANSQTAGRGQPGKSWTALPGSLAFSILIPAQSSGVLGLVMANAVAQAIEGLAGQDQVSIKWPNDLMIEDRKLGGLLIENVTGTSSSNRATVVGLGLNVNNPPPLISEPQSRGLVKKAISLNEFFGRAFPMEETLAAIAGKMLKDVGRISLDSAGLITACHSRFKYIGQRIRFEEPGGKEVTGVVHGFSANGELVLKVEGKEQTFRSGQIVHCEG